VRKSVESIDVVKEEQTVAEEADNAEDASLVVPWSITPEHGLRRNHQRKFLSLRNYSSCFTLLS
jgi:hypothetical protein